MGWINEFFTKPILKLKRASHLYMLEKVNELDRIDYLYTLSKKERGAIFAEILKEYPLKFTDIDKKFKHIRLKKPAFLSQADTHLMRFYLQW